MWNVIIHNIGQEPHVFTVYQDDTKRPAQFTTQEDAMEAVRLIDRMRIDSAYEGCSIRQA